MWKVLGKGLGKVQTQFREEFKQRIGRVQGLGKGLGQGFSWGSGKVPGKGLRGVRPKVWVRVRDGPIFLLHWSANCFKVAVYENFFIHIYTYINSHYKSNIRLLQRLWIYF